MRVSVGCGFCDGEQQKFVGDGPCGAAFLMYMFGGRIFEDWSCRCLGLGFEAGYVEVDVCGGIVAVFGYVVCKGRVTRAKTFGLALYFLVNDNTFDSYSLR